MVLAPPRRYPSPADLASLDLDVLFADPALTGVSPGPGLAPPALGPGAAAPGPVGPAPDPKPEPPGIASEPDDIEFWYTRPQRQRRRRRRRLAIAVVLVTAAVTWAGVGSLRVRALPPSAAPTSVPAYAYAPNKSVIIQARARQRRRRRRIAMSTLPVIGAGAGWFAGGGRPPWHRSRPDHRGRGRSTPGPASRAENLPGLAALNHGRAQVNALSCPSAGDCALGGYYTDSTGHSQAFLASQAGGRWARATEVPGTAELNIGDSAQLMALSCASAGNCVAGGYYASSHGQQGFLIAENRGTWDRARPVPGLAALNSGGLASVTALSCASAGNCAAAGSYVSGSHMPAFVVTETHGRWGTAQPVTGPSALPNRGVVVLAISCTSTGNCTAGGTARAGSGSTLFAVSETGGVWGTAQRIPVTAAMNKARNLNVASMSCVSAGNCALGGGYGNAAHGQAFVASQTGGNWARAQPVPGMAALHSTGGAETMAVSCPAAGRCAAGGQYNDAAGRTQAFIVSLAGGTWQAAREVPGTAALNAGGNALVNGLSCAPAGKCTASGDYIDAAGHARAFVATQAGGAWQAAREVPGIAALATRRGDAMAGNLSCPPAGPCGIAGQYDHPGQYFTVFVTGTR
jgi:hypothetical protein